MKVFLSAGHGGKDPGAIDNGLQEKDLNLWIMTACGDYLERQGIVVVRSRTKDEDDPVTQEVQEANASGADLAVSFHNNAGGGDGSETWYYANSDRSRRLAILLEGATQSLGQNSRGVKATTSLWFLRDTTMNAALCETAFIDSPDISFIDTKHECERVGVAYGAAICQFLNWKQVYDSTQVTLSDFQPYMIRVKCPLNYRTAPGVENKRAGTINDRNVYTIVEERKSSDGGTWGRLKSGAGWINVSRSFVEVVSL